MAAKFKGNYRKENAKSNKVFGLPFLPLLIFLVLLIALLILPQKGITGRIVDVVSLSKLDYNPRELLNGTLFIELRWGDHIPMNTKAVFSFVNVNGTVVNSTTYDLPVVIRQSLTPWNGNVSNGTFNNVNGPEPVGEGLGFEACKAIPIVQPPQSIISGEAISVPQIPIQMPDLTVMDIYTAASAISPSFASAQPPGTTPIERLYTVIANQGGASTSGGPTGVVPTPFKVIGCWITPEQVAPDCFFEQGISEMAAGASMILDMGAHEVQGKTVLVVIDSTNVIVESNENNNQLTRTFGAVPIPCVDKDNGNPFEKGECTDGGMLPFVKVDTCMEDNRTLNEFWCPSPEGLCQVQEINCNGTCFDGKCVPISTPDCNETDGGYKPFVFGTCKDKYEELNDICLEVVPGEPNIAERYCIGNNLIYNEGVPMWDSECDLCSKVECRNIGTRSEGWYADCPKGEKHIVWESCANRGKFMPVCLYSDSKSEGWYTPDVCGTLESVCNYGCSQGACKWSNYTCDDWNNVYEIPLSRLVLKAPADKGQYMLNVSLTYEDSNNPKMVLYSTVSDKFNVNSHRACIGVNNCAWIAGIGPDGCTSNAQCGGGPGGGGGGGGACIESWTYGTWSECIAGQRTRECYDSRKCGTTFAKPTYCLPSGNKFMHTESCVPGCQESWQCSEWSYCNQETQEQSAVCEEMNKCNPMNYTYIQLRDCCAEQWDCKWGSCVNGVQEKVCVDLNNCGTEFTKPPADTRNCKGMMAWWTWVIIAVVVIGAVLGILYATKVIKFPKKAKAPAEEEAHFTEIKV